MVLVKDSGKAEEEDAYGATFVEEITNEGKKRVNII